MSAVRAYSVLAVILAAILGSPSGASAAKAPKDLSDECVGAGAKAHIKECPGGPKEFNIKKKRAVAFKSAPPPRKLKKRKDAKPRDPTQEMETAFRDTRKTRLKQRARALLVTEITGLERLLARQEVP